ncbi:MAG: tRNA preQ1(34) S-adenosylmethionine ribosyltransferase-isomerase QueA [Lentisphaeria bacterium]|nr:tRNA preQ1(34) S-adenosylmethionine ribosyltransferase-isomerase QueA [Lentisphaeria bacterium]
MTLATNLFDYVLPEELIAQYPADKRGDSKMLVLDPNDGHCEIHPFADIVNYLNADDVMVCNNTKVLQGRMYGIKNGDVDGAKFEMLLVANIDKNNPKRWSALLKPGKRAKAGTFVQLTDSDGSLNSNGDGFTVLGRYDDDTFEIEFNRDDVESLQKKYGHIPLPPYIRRGDSASDYDRYQTLFASEAGAVAAPTAGLHFSDKILTEIDRKGVIRKELTLHVGPGTFKTVSVDDVTKHKMHFEEYFFPSETAEIINQAKKEGRNVLAIGTTTVRTLESCVNQKTSLLEAKSGKTDIFLYPPYEIKGCNMLLTNFHLPKSTLLMLVSCFVDREVMLEAYEFAKANKLRFYSYGDCMLILPKKKN